MIDKEIIVNVAKASASPSSRNRNAAVEPISQINLLLHGSDQSDVFAAARLEVLMFAARRAGGHLPPEAFEGESFSTDDIGARRIEAISINDPRYWSLRFDDDDRSVPSRSWVIEVALAEQEKNGPVLFGVRLQCIARGENPSYDRSIPVFVRDVLAVCDARLDGRPISMKPWIIDTEEEVEELVNLLCSENRTADVLVQSLPENSNKFSDELISSENLARNLAGAAHVAVISGKAAFLLSDRVGREFSVFNQAIRTYRPAFNPDAEAPFRHPLSIAERIRNWDGGPDAYRKFISSAILRHTVDGTEAFKRLPSFAEAKRTAAQLRRQNAKQAGSSVDELLPLAEEEIEQLKMDLALQKEESDALLTMAGAERERAESQVQRMQSTLYHLQQRISVLENSGAAVVASSTPDTLDELEQWAAKQLSGSVELHNRALRGAKASEYEDVAVIYDALLLLRDYYVPMRREGGEERRQAFDQRCQELGMEEQQSFSGSRAGEHGDTYFIKLGTKRIELDRHLKKGNSREPRYCFRLYFLWDETTSQVIVGWLPSHLSTRAS